MKSSPTSAVNLQALLESLSLSPTSTSHTLTVDSLAKKLQQEHDLGPLADDQLFVDLARALFACRDRFLSQTDDIDSEQEHDDDDDDDDDMQRSYLQRRGSCVRTASFQRGVSSISSDSSPLEFLPRQSQAEDIKPSSPPPQQQQQRNVNDREVNCDDNDDDDDEEEEEDVSFRSTFETSHILYPDMEEEDLREDMETLRLNSKLSSFKNHNESQLPPEFLRRFDEMGNVQSNPSENLRPSKKDDEHDDVGHGFQNLHKDKDEKIHNVGKNTDSFYSHITPTKPPRGGAGAEADPKEKDGNNASFMDENGDFHSPCSFATAREALDTHERHVERQRPGGVAEAPAAPKNDYFGHEDASVRQDSDAVNGDSDAATAEREHLNSTTTFAPPPDDSDVDDSDLFSPAVGPSSTTKKMASSWSKAAASAKTPLFRNVSVSSSSFQMEESCSTTPLSPPTIQRGGDASSSNVGSSSSSLRRSDNNNNNNATTGKKTLFGNDQDELNGTHHPDNHKEKDDAHGNVTSQTGQMPENPPTCETVPTNDTPLTSPPQSTLNVENLVFKVDLSKKSKGKGAKRGSPRIPRTVRGKKASVSVPFEVKTTLPFPPIPPMTSSKNHVNESTSSSQVGTGTHNQNVADGDSEPEEMDIDSMESPGTDVPARAHVGDNNLERSKSSLNTGVGLKEISFSIGTGGQSTPNRKGTSASRKLNKGQKPSNRASKVGPSSPSNGRRTHAHTGPFPFSPPKSEAQKAVEQEQLLRRQEVTRLRDMAKTFYTEKKYKESVNGYTEAILAHTKNFSCMPSPLKKTDDSEILASMFGNRAAGLMMLGAYDACAKDCERALNFLADYNPLCLDLKDRDQLISYIKTDGGLTYMTKFYARMGRAQMKIGKLDEADATFDRTIRISKSALACHEKIVKHAAYNNIVIPHEMQKMSEKVIQQCLTDAMLNKTDISRVREHSKYIQKQGGIRRAVDTAMAQNNNPHLLHYVDKILQVTPADERMQESKVICFASMKRWRDIIRFCETLGCKNSLYDGVFLRDLHECNPHKGIPHTQYLRSHVIESIEKGTYCLTADEASEASLRLPNTVVKMYVRALRLEEKYKEGEAVLGSLEHLSKIAGPIWSPDKKSHKARYHWLSVEKDKLLSTMREKSRGDRYYREGRYEEAASCYARVMMIDSESGAYSSSHVYEVDTMGGRLHAVLFCNRAACLIGLKKYDEAAKECTAALRIEKGYMKAILRRARCYNRLERYEESISEYNRWIHAVQEAKRNPHFKPSDECPFDRAADISDMDMQKVYSEVANVKERKSSAELKARQQAEEAQRRAQSAYNRQQSQQQDWQYQRRWDSFRGSAPNREKKRSPHRRNKGHPQEYYNNKQSSKFNTSSSSSHDYQRQEGPKASPSSDAVICHYAVLQVDTSATQVDIKKAYRRLALKYHPDKNQNSVKAASVFRKVQLAYETLSDENSKRKYDMELRLRSHR